MVVTEPSHHGLLCSQTSQNSFSIAKYCSVYFPGPPSFCLWPTQATVGRKKKGGTNLDMAHSGPWVSEMIGKTPAELMAPLGWASVRLWQTLASVPAAALLLPQEQPGAQDSQVAVRCSLSLEGQQTFWQYLLPYLQLSLKVKVQLFLASLFLPWGSLQILEQARTVPMDGGHWQSDPQCLM